MADKRSKLVLDILARVQGAAETARLGKAIEGVGDEMTGAAKDAKVLEKAIDDVQDEIRDLNRELLRTGDIDIDRKLRISRGTLSALSRMRKELGDVEVEAKKTGSSLGAALGALPAQLRGGLIVGLVGAGATAAPLLGAVISSAVIGGVGAGGILGGVALAARNTSVRNAAEDLADRFTEPLDQLEFAFADPVIKALDVLGDAGTDVLSQLMPDLRALAPVVVDIAEGIGGFARAAAPGLSATLREAGPLLQALADELPGFGQAVGDALEMIAGGGEEAAEGLRTLFFIAEASLTSSAFAIRGLTEAFGLFKDITENPALLAFTSVAGAFTHHANQMSQQALKPLTGDAQEATSAFDVLNEETIGTTSSLHTAAAAAGSLHAALQLLNGEELNAREAQRQFQGAIDAVTQSIEDNGRTLDITTEAGRNNQQALDNIAQTAMTAADAIYEQTGSQEAATDAIRDGRGALIDAAIQMGVSRERARELADEILAIPREWTTGARFDDQAARNRLNDYRALLEDLDGRTAVTTVINRVITQTFGVNASQITKRWGGVVAAQRGRVVPAHITDSPTVLYGERATGREAFVPMHGDRNRSLQILREAASWYGMTVGRGGAVASRTSGTSTRQAMRQPDSRELARLVGREVGRALSGVRIIVDDQGRGRMEALRADRYDRGG